MTTLNHTTDAAREGRIPASSATLWGSQPQDDVQTLHCNPNYSEIILDSAGNTYVGDVAQPFAYGKLKLPSIFAIDDACFHVFEIIGEKIIHRASQSTRALAQNYMSDDRVCVYRRYQFEHTHEGLGVNCKYCGAPHYPAGCRVYRKADNTWTNVP